MPWPLALVLAFLLVIGGGGDGGEEDAAALRLLAAMAVLDGAIARERACACAKVRRDASDEWRAVETRQDGASRDRMSRVTALQLLRYGIQWDRVHTKQEVTRGDS